MVHISGILIFLLYVGAAVALLIALYRPASRAAHCGRLIYRGALGGTLLFVAVRAVLDWPILQLLPGDYFLYMVLACNLLALSMKLTAPVLELILASVTLTFFTGSSLLFHDSGREAVHTSEVVVLALHIVPALLAQASLVLAGVAAAAYLWIRRKLKRRAVDAITLTGPGLGHLEKAHRILCLLGFSAMTVAVFTGAAQGGASVVDWSDPTQGAAFSTWALLAFLVHLHSAGRVSMQRTALITVLGVVLIAAGSFSAYFFNGASRLHAFSEAPLWLTWSGL